MNTKAKDIKLDMVEAKVRESRKNMVGRNDMDKFLFLNLVNSFKIISNIKA